MTPIHVSNISQPVPALAGLGGIQELHAADGRTVTGFRIGGKKPGPRAVVFASGTPARRVFQQLLLLPSLSHLHGELLLVYAQAPGARPTPAELLALSDLPIDEVLSLPLAKVENFRAEQQAVAEKSGYWNVLRLCARLGMIAGRGVPRARRN